MWTTTVAQSSAFEDNGTQKGPRRSMPIPAVNSTDVDQARLERQSSAVDDAAIERERPPSILV